MAKKERQHYVPAMYLRGFVDAGTTQQELYLYEYNRMPRRRAPKTVGWEHCFYDLNEFEDPKEVENMLELIETDAGPILKKLGSGDMNLSLEQRVMLAEFLGLSVTRTPYYRALSDHVVIEGQKEIARGFLQEPEVFTKTLAAIEIQEGESIETDEASLRDFMTRMVDGKIPMRQENKAWSIQTILKSAHHLADVIVNLRWVLIEPQNPDDRFITNDNPVLVQDLPEPDTSPHNYTTTPNFQFFFPVSPSYLLLGEVSSKPDTTGTLNHDMVLRLREKYVKRAYKQVYASFRSGELQALVDKHHHGRSAMPELPAGFLGLGDPTDWLKY